MQGVVSRVGFSRGSSEPCKSRIINTEVLPCLVGSELGAASCVIAGRVTLWRGKFRPGQSSQVKSRITIQK